VIQPNESRQSLMANRDAERENRGAVLLNGINVRRSAIHWREGRLQQDAEPSVASRKEWRFRNEAPQLRFSRAAQERRTDREKSPRQSHQRDHGRACGGSPTVLDEQESRDDAEKARSQGYESVGENVDMPQPHRADNYYAGE